MAVLIFGILMIAVTQTFRMGLRAWNTGHGMSEMLQSVRITQDVILSDLNHIIYLSESEYNRTFREQTNRIASLVRSVNGEEYNMNYRVNRRREDRRRRSQERNEREIEELMELEDISLEDVATPVNLTFQGGNSGKKDDLIFTRRQQVRRNTDVNGWGVRRIRYQIENGTLYRSEEDAFGYSPGSASRTGMINSPELMNIMYSFVDENERNERRYQDWKISPDEINFEPVQISHKEPMCHNVEIFDIVYGYFKDNEWMEVQDWNSGQLKHRSPPLYEDEFYFEDGIHKERIPDLGMGAVDALAMQQERFQPRVPDDLPGYMAIQLGLRTNEGKGKIHSFTLYHMMPQGQESDLWTDMEDERGYRSNRRRDRYKRRELKNRDRNSRFRRPNNRR